ncbi:MAG: phosphohydrolase [Ideonella sp. MAG2]|nr:MAG: phosphohydrolase [Ideonella sp. MAG2]
MTVKVPVEDLRVGMFIHLDLGWMSHPFPLSSFKISSQEQIDTLRGLGLSQVRWDAARSDELQTLHEPVAADPIAASEPPTALISAETPGQRQAKALASQEATQRLSEKQFGEACRELKHINDLALSTPAAARDACQQLTRALLDKMLVGDAELCLRLLGEPNGDRATAHAMNVSVLSLLLAKHLGWPEHELLDLGTGALLHDIGKLNLPDRLRQAQDNFTPAEQAAYRDHVAQGIVLGRRMGLTAGSLLVLAQHHEMVDGSGFPAGCTQERMTQAARIVAIVNHYDKLCNPAVLGKALTPHEALSRMFAQSRSRFDINLLNAFIRMMGVYPPGSVVQLSDERFALVMTVNAERPLKPTVLVHDPRASRQDHLHLNLEAASELGIRRNLRPEQLPLKTAEFLAPRQRLNYFFGTDVNTPLAA